MQLLVSLFIWISSLQEVAWFLIGGISVAGLTFLYLKLKKLQKFTIPSFILAVLAVLIFAFAVLWAVASWEENEAIAASLGLVIFGGLAAIFGIIAYRLIATGGEGGVLKRLIPLRFGKK